ncbi:MAG: FtsQ-type POTRA domain-containing protein [Endomicrobium sp.]|jgi:cell division protein FtsQ|nr:FtsQ-type POTRA domain-containing protein [Endomicrobium sp.]
MSKKRYIYKAVYTNIGSHKNKCTIKSVKFFFCLLILIIFIFLAYVGYNKLMDVVYKSKKIIVENIEIIGANNITKSEIKELLPFNLGDNLLKINLSESENEIKKLKPELKNITIKRGWQKVKIRLYERTPEAFIVCNNVLLGIDFDNIPFPLCGFMNETKVPKITCRSCDERKRLLNFIKKFKSVSGKFLGEILEIRFGSTGDIIFVMNGDIVVFWGEEIFEHLPCKFKRFQKIYAHAIAKYKQIDYIDITLYCLGRAIVKPVLE